MEIAPLEKLRVEIKRARPFQGIDKVLGRVVGGHTQTLLGHFLPSLGIDLGKTERIDLEVSNGDHLVGFSYKSKAEKSVGLLHVFHGLAGTSDSLYMSRAAHAALSVGYDVVLWNHRGCGTGRKLALEPYHSGRSDDLARVVRWGRKRNSDKSEYLHALLGYSLSANAACLLASQVVPAIDTQPLSSKAFQRIGDQPDFAIAVNPPFDLKLASDRLSRGPSKVYGQAFMPAMLESLEDRKSGRPTNDAARTMVNLAARAREKLSVLDNVGTFDSAYTGPAGGFQDHLDYYSRASSGRYLQTVKIPLIILSADDDPITHGFKDLPNAESSLHRNPLIVVDDQPEGGHMGYVDRSTLLSPLQKRSRWLEQRIEMYLKAFLPVLVGAFLISALSGCSLVDALQSGVGPSAASQTEGQLVDCPIDPNCVSTQATRAEQAIVPFTYSKPVDEARQALKQEMAKLPDTTLVKEEGAYLHFECRSKVLRLVDDVEFLFNEETKTLQFRSASRFGYSDWGANRKRMETIRNKILGHI